MSHQVDNHPADPNEAAYPEIRRAPGIRLAQVESDLLQRAFAQSQSLFVEREFRSGYSGALVLLVSIDSGRAPVVVKIAPAHDLQREHDAFHRYVLPSAPQNTAHLQGPPLLHHAQDLGLLIYTFAGGDPRHPAHNLRDYYDAQGGEATGALLNRIFRSYGRHWWAINRPRKFVLGEYYDHLLPVHLELTPQPPSEDVQHVLRAGASSIVDLRQLAVGHTVRLRGFQVAKIKRAEQSLTLTCAPPSGEASAPLRLRVIHAPLDLWRVGQQVETINLRVTETRQTLLTNAAQQALIAVGMTPALAKTHHTSTHHTALGTLDPAELLRPLPELHNLLDRVLEARFSTIHGDLNLNNVLVDMPTGFAWLIDFAETRHGPTLYDLQRLEVQVIIKLLPELFQQQRAQVATAASTAHSTAHTTAHTLASVTALATLFHALHADPPSPVAPDAMLQEPYVLLAHIRRLARQYLMDDLEWDEYYLGLMVALLGALKFDELDAQARCLALTAAASLQKLLGVPPRRGTATMIQTTQAGPLVPADPALAQIAQAAEFASTSPVQLPALLPTLTPPPEPTRPPRVDHFVGRDAEMVAFAERLTSTRLAVINGMAGVGKTALAATLTNWVATPERVFWHSFHEGDGLNTIIWKAAAFLARHGEAELWRLLETTRQTGGQPPPTETLIDYLLQLLRGQNYLLCFDDLHLVEDDSAFQRFFTQLRQILPDSALMLLITTRRLPEFLPQTEEEPLQGLGADDMRRLLSARGLHLDPALEDELHRRTAGNAQFLTLAINILQQAGDPALLVERLAETNDVERYLLAAVDEGLSGGERSVMGAVAVLLNYPGTRDAIESILTGGNIWRTLHRLQERHLLTVSHGEEGKEYWQHAIVQNFYYQGLGRRQRRVMHQRAGEFYATEEPDLLRAGIHYERAAAYELAAQQATADVWAMINRGQARALRLLLERFQPNQLPPEQWAEVHIAQGVNEAFLDERQQASQNFQNALADLNNLPPSPRVQQLKAKVCLGMAELLELETPEDALTWLERGLAETADPDAAPEGVERAALQIKMGTARLYLGRYDEARTALESGLAQLTPGPSQLRSVALTNLGSISFFQGELTRALALQQQALVISQQLHDQFRSVNILSNLAISKYCQGDWADAIVSFKESLALAETLGSQQLQAEVSINLGAAFINTGDDEDAERYLQKSLQLARENSLRVIEAFAQLRLADLRIRLGRWAAAAIYLSKAEEVARAISHQSTLIAILRYWAEIKLAQDDLQAALHHVHSSLELAAELAERMEQGEGLRVLGAVLQQLGEHQQALAAFEESVQILVDEDPYQAARTLVLLGRFLLEAEQPSRGDALLQEAARIFARLGANRDLAQLT